MEPTNRKQNTILSIIAGFIGISTIIMVHELGHYTFASLFNVPAPLFSLGLGPALGSYQIGETLFQISLLPFGGYVQLDEVILGYSSYLSKIIIMLGGIIFNFLLTGIILLFLSLTTKTSSFSHKECFDYIRNHHASSQPFIGPIGIIQLIGQSFTTNIKLFLYIIALISLNIGLFNLIPLSFFDGGKVLFYIIESISGPTVAKITLSATNLLVLLLLLMLMNRKLIQTQHALSH